MRGDRHPLARVGLFFGTLGDSKVQRILCAVEEQFGVPLNIVGAIAQVDDLTIIGTRIPDGAGDHRERYHPCHDQPE